MSYQEIDVVMRHEQRQGNPRGSYLALRKD